MKGKTSVKIWALEMVSFLPMWILVVSQFDFDNWQFWAFFFATAWVQVYWKYAYEARKEGRG
ncbi:MAG: hypothetical protein ACK5X3_15380 [Pseudomonadota bacterium]